MIKPEWLIPQQLDKEQSREKIPMSILHLHAVSKELPFLWNGFVWIIVSILVMYMVFKDDVSVCTCVSSCAIVNQQTSCKCHSVGVWYCLLQVCCCRSHRKQWNYPVEQWPLAGHWDLQQNVFWPECTWPQVQNCESRIHRTTLKSETRWVKCWVF